MKNLIKRKKDNFDFNVQDGWYCEVKKNSNPNGSNAGKDEVIYIAQSGYAVFAKGIIEESNFITKYSLRDFVKYAMHESKVKDPIFWLSKIKDYSLRDDFKTINIFEYKIGQTVLFESAIPLEKRFLYQSSWYRIEDDYTFPEADKNTLLTKHIPSKIRTEVFHKFKINSTEYSTDIDHFVPAVLGGPGNIIENLVPIGSSINRRKGKDVPSKLFDFGKKFDILMPSGLVVAHDVFYKTPKMLTLAKLIIEKINLQDIKDLREDYKAIRDFHFPSLRDVK